MQRTKKSMKNIEKMDNISVSVIVPIYNAEKYLEKCLQSIINQTLKNIEIILIDDGSQDGSAEICHRFLECDNRIRYYRKENEGLAAARQDGIERARGEYIGFVDSDDWLELNMYERMYQEAIKSNADIVFCNCYTDENEKNPIHLESGVYDREKIEKYILPRTLAGLTEKGANSVIRWSNCLRIYRNELLQSNHIQFDRRFRRSQDLQLTFETTLCAKVYVSLNDEYLYHNRNNDNGQSLSRGYTENYWGLIRPLIDRLDNDIEKYQRTELIDKMHLCTFFFANQGIINECEKSTKPLKQRLDNLKLILKDERVRKAIENIEEKRLNQYYQMIYMGLSSDSAWKAFGIYKSYPIRNWIQNKTFMKMVRAVLNNRFIEPIYILIRKKFKSSYISERNK